MAKFRYQHIKSSVEGKAPTAAQIKTAEIGVNDFAGDEKLFIKNSEGEVVDFPRGYSQAYIDEAERVTAEALNDLNSRKLDASAYTPTDLSNYYTKDETSGKTEIQDALDDKADTATTYTKTEVDARDLWVSGTGTNSVAQKGGNNTASGSYSHAEGNDTTASGLYSHAEGSDTVARGFNSHAEGWTTTAGGDYSHAEGNSTTASGDSSHAEGRWTRASGGYGSHAEGYYAVASGTSSHAEGQWTRANGDYSHAEGYYTITLNDSEHASGQYNDSVSASTTFGNSGNTLFSVGNGTAENARHNAFEIRQNGDIYLSDGTKLQDAIDITIDQVIDSGTSASTDAVSTSAVYGFVTSYTPSITVDQDFSNTASTNPISTKAVYSAVTDNELVWTNAFVTLSGVVSSHTENTEIHVTAADKEKLHAHSNKTALDSITGNVGTMAYQDAASYSSATEVNTALGNKAETTALTQVNNTLTAHTADTTIHVTAADKTAWNAKVDASAIADFFDDAKYEDSGTTKVINFYHGNTIKATIDASDFIVDGMVDDVRIENGNLVIDFNTASGKQDISIPLTDIFDPSNYYDKDDIDDLVGSGFTLSSITDVIIENEEIVSAALTDLDERKLDASAYTPTDLSNYYTKSETSGATEISTALADKADTATTYTKAEVDARNLWVSGTGTNSVAQKGGNNTASGNYSHAEGQSTSATSYVSHAEGFYTTASGDYSHTEGFYTTAVGTRSHAEGSNTTASGNYGSHAEGYGTSASSDSSHAEGYNTITLNNSEHASGRYNDSVSASTTFGNGGNTLFSVGNGTTSNARHNAFEIRQNGDIYITSGGTNASPSIKLQDYIGSVETVTAITPSNSGSTEPIATKFVAENELVMANALNDLESRKLDASAYTTTSAVTSGSTDAITSGGVYAQLDGIKIKKITQSAYDALVQAGTVDANTLYFITD